MRRLLLLAAVLGLATTGCARDTYGTAYDDFVQARQQDAVDRGWIPAMLPEEATDLRELHAPAEDTAVATATLPSGRLPDECAETTTDVGAPPLEPGWLPTEALARGAPVRCGVWQGVVDGRTLVLWTDRASEAEPED